MWVALCCTIKMLLDNNGVHVVSLSASVDFNASLSCNRSSKIEAGNKVKYPVSCYRRCIFRSCVLLQVCGCRSSSSPSQRLHVGLFIERQRGSSFQNETGTDSCLHDNFSPATTPITGFCVLRPHRVTSSEHWDFNYPAHISNTQHSYCEFGTLFLFSCSFVSFKLPVASKRKANKTSFHSLVK